MIIHRPVVMTFVFVMLCAAASGRGEPEIRIESCAVLPFGGAPPGDRDLAHNISLLTQRYVRQLSRAGECTVRSWRQTARALNRAGFRAEAYDSAWKAAEEAGRILGVTHVIAGSVECGASSITLATTLVDVERGEGVRGATSRYEGSFATFIEHAPKANAAVLLGSRETDAPVSGPPRPAPRQTAAVRSGADESDRRGAAVSPRISPSRDETDGDYRAWIRPLRTWSFPWGDGKEKPAFRTRSATKPESPPLAFVRDRLDIGARVGKFRLDQHNGSFIGTVVRLDENQSQTPDLFVSWWFFPYVGLEWTRTEVSAEAETDTHPEYSDGSLEMKGPLLSLYGRYPFEMDLGHRTVKVTPYAGVGLSSLSARFRAAGWWRYGFPNLRQYNQWEAAGRPASSASDYERAMSVTDDTGHVWTLGCCVVVWRRLSVDLCFRTVDTATDVTYVRSYANGNSETSYGYFPMSHKTYSLGLRYSF